ncbi:MAG: M48 family metalloprotease [Planctomycetota bacterium]|nr:M48 family metalloprotease [Planctomycetota bacterium]
MVLLPWCLGRVLVESYLREMRSGITDSKRIRTQKRMLSLYEWSPLIVYSGVVMGMGWTRWVDEDLGLSGSVLVGDLLRLLPFVLAQITTLVPIYRLGSHSGHSFSSLGSMLGFHFRMNWIPVVPVLMMSSLAEWAARLPSEWLDPIEVYPFLGWCLLLPVLGCLVVGFPPILILLLGTRTMPPGETRDRLDEILGKRGVKIRDFRVWTIPHPQMLNAAVVGLTKRWRYVIFTSALLDALSEEELVAVLAHENGHIEAGHQKIFMGMAILFYLTLYGPSRWLEPILGEVLFSALLLAAFGLFFGVFLFGWLSRRLEREADLIAAEIVGSPLRMSLCLTRVAFLAGHDPDQDGWRHGSVSGRVGFLASVSNDSRIGRQFRERLKRVIRRVKGSLLLFLIPTLVLAGQEWISPYMRIQELIEIRIESGEFKRARQLLDRYPEMRFLSTKEFRRQLDLRTEEEDR